MNENKEQQKNKQREDKENFSVKVTPAEKKRYNEILKKYTREGEAYADGLKRIFDLAESDMTRGTHPELENHLRAVDGTISVLIKQINGIVAGQDAQLDDMRSRLNSAVEERNAAEETARKVSAEARSIAGEAKESVKKAEHEREEAIRARDDARSIADEKSRSNDLLLSQVKEMREDLDDYKTLRADYEDLKEKSIRDAAEAELAKEKAVIDKEREMILENARLQAKVEHLQEQIAHFSDIDWGEDVDTAVIE